MKTIALKGELRTDLGKRAAKELRAEGKVPCIMYGQGESINFTVYESDFQNLVYTPNSYLVRLDVEGRLFMCKVQELQFHPVSEAILHADFYNLDVDDKVKVQIPVRVKGNSPGVREGGKLNVKMRKLNVLGYIKDLPDFIEVNVDSLELGKNIRVREIEMGELTPLDTLENSVVSVNVTRASKSAAGALADEEAEGTEEGAEEATEEASEE